MDVQCEEREREREREREGGREGGRERQVKCVPAPDNQSALHSAR